MDYRRIKLAMTPNQNHNPELPDQLLQYDAFTDIVFSPERQINSQAESAALYMNLARSGLLDKALFL